MTKTKKQKWWISLGAWYPMTSTWKSECLFLSFFFSSPTHGSYACPWSFFANSATFSSHSARYVNAATGVNLYLDTNSRLLNERRGGKPLKGKKKRERKGRGRGEGKNIIGIQIPCVSPLSISPVSILFTRYIHISILILYIRVAICICICISLYIYTLLTSFL